MRTVPRTITSPIVEAGMRTVIGTADGIGCRLCGRSGCRLVLVLVLVSGGYPWGYLGVVTTVTVGTSSLVTGLFQKFRWLGLTLGRGGCSLVSIPGHTQSAPQRRGMIARTHPVRSAWGDRPTGHTQSAAPPVGRRSRQWRRPSKSSGTGTLLCSVPLGGKRGP